MKRASILFAFILVALATACTTIDRPNASGDGAAINPIGVRDIVVSSCRFRPLLSTVNEIIGKGVPTLSTADAIAGAICKIVADNKDVYEKTLPTGLETATQLPKLAGVPIQGSFE